MKIYCEKCNKDISKVVDSNIEHYVPGKVKCPYCSKVQKRYLSEADLLMYFAISCVLYIFVALIFISLFDIVGAKWYLLLIIMFIIVCLYFVQKYISRAVYKYAFGKAEIKDKEMVEDYDAVTKRMKSQYSLFMFMILMLGTGIYDLWLFIIPSIVITLSSFIKLYKLIKQEKASIK